jgi:hypothetical protein
LPVRAAQDCSHLVLGHAVPDLALGTLDVANAGTAIVREEAEIAAVSQEKSQVSEEDEQNNTRA